MVPDKFNMVDMDEIDVIIGLHVENWLQSGKIAC